MNKFFQFILNIFSSPSCSFVELKSLKAFKQYLRGEIDQQTFSNMTWYDKPQRISNKRIYSK